MRRLLTASLLLALVLTVNGGSAVTAQTTEPVEPEVVDLLVFSETAGFRHSSIETGNAAFQTLAAEEVLEDVDFTVEVVGDSVGAFTPENLARFDVVVWLSTTGDVLDDVEQQAFEEYIQGGGGYMGIHAAADTEYTWPWYYDLVGAQFKSHPAITEATIDVEDREHVATAHLPERWTRTDEWYNYKRNPRSYVCNTEEEAPGVETGTLGTYVAIFYVGVDIPPSLDPREKNCGVNVLMSLDESTYTNNQDAMGDHPIAWCNEWDGGRAFYTGLGHTEESYSEADFLQHVTGGLLAAAGAAGVECEPDEGTDPEPEPEPVAPLQNVVVSGPSATSVGFTTTEVVITQGSTVDLVNADTQGHEVVCGEPGRPDGRCKSKLTATGQMSPVEGVEDLPPGPQPFFCGLHPLMVGTFTVV